MVRIRTPHMQNNRIKNSSPTNHESFTEISTKENESLLQYQITLHSFDSPKCLKMSIQNENYQRIVEMLPTYQLFPISNVNFWRANLKLQMKNMKL